MSNLSEYNRLVDDIEAADDRLLRFPGQRTAEPVLPSFERERGGSAPALLPGRHLEHRMVGEHPSMQQLYRTVAAVAPTALTVLVQGESGTGKELVAEAIHRNSDRADRPFIRCNCAALAAGVIESELFGHVKGAFSGAVKGRVGRFEQADGGTLFLDEIGDLDIGLQVRLLRVLQEGTFEPVGSNQTRRVDVRLITATNKDLEKAIAAGGFREDLYYRINAIAVEVPPLRKRKSDIPLLCEHFVARHCEALGKDISWIDEAALQQIVDCDWPGNVREMENALLRTIVMVDGDAIEERHLPFGPAMAQVSCDEAALPEWSDCMYEIPQTDFHLARRQFEQVFIRRALSEVGGNVSHAAQMIRLGRRNLQRKLKQYEINAKAYAVG